MERKIVGLGLLAGLLGGLASFGFARLLVTPVIGQAIEHEEHSHEHEVFTRAAQENVGAGAGSVVFALAMGALFAVAFISMSTYLSRRLISVDPRWTALMLAGAGFVTLQLAPFIAYPANPPGVGLAETIGARTTAYLAIVGLSVGAALAAVAVTLRLAQRIGGWAATASGVVGYLIAVSVAIAFLPHFDETPPDFPAGVLADFRMYSVLSQAILWLVIGGSFAVLLPRALGARPAAQPSTQTGAVHAHR